MPHRPRCLPPPAVSGPRPASGIRRGALAAPALLLAISAGPACAPDDTLDGTEATEVTDSPSPVDQESQQALMTNTARPTRSIAAMMFNIGGGNPNATTIMNVIGGTGQSQRHIYQEISYGIQDLAPEYFGPFTLPVNNCLTIACCGPSSDRTGNGPTVQMLMDGLGKTFNHYFWVYGAIPTGANCGTWGDEGSPNRYATYSSYSFHQLVGYAQEIGHNMGMTHEPTLTCTGQASFLDNTAQCTHKEYGNLLSFMGGGGRHPSAYHKYHQGWIGGCNVVKAGASDTFTLVPQELPCDGVQLIQVPAPKTRAAPAAGDRQGTGPMLTHYYLEMRAPLGFDSGLGPMVLVSIGSDLPSNTRAAPYVYLLDLAPTTTTLNDAGLRTAGQSYSDPAGGLTITLDAIDSTSASVTIAGAGAGTNSCSNNMAFTAPGPGATSCGPLFGGGGSTGGGTGGAGGRAGTGGATGAGGAGTGGRGGAGGAGGAVTPGSGGGGGRAGTGGNRPGTGGATIAGTGGGAVVGTGGATTVTPGTGGATAAGTGGNPVTGGGTGGSGTTGPGASEVSGGCACDAAGSASSGGGGLGLLLGSAIVVSVVARRRRSHGRKARV